MDDNQEQSDFARELEQADRRIHIERLKKEAT